MFVFGNFCLSLSESRFARIKVWWTVLLSLCDDRADAGITPFLELSVNRLGGMLSKRNVESQHQLLESRAFLWRQSHHYSYSETQHGIGNFLFTGNENKGSNFALMCAGLDLKVSPRLYASRLLTSTGSGVRVHATEGPPFSRALYVALTLALAYPSYFLCSTDQYSAYWIWWLSGCVTQCFPFWLWPSTCLLDSFTDLLNFSWFIWLSLVCPWIKYW